MTTIEEITEYIESMGLDMEQFTGGNHGPLTALHTYEGGDYGSGYVEQYGDYVCVTVENDGTDESLEACEQMLYVWMTPADEE